MSTSESGEEPGIPSPDEARDWLKASGKTPDLSVRWSVAPVEDPAVMNAILDILFRPRAKPDAA